MPRTGPRMAVGVCPEGKPSGHHVTPAPFHPTENHPEDAGRGCSCERICAGTSRMSDAQAIGKPLPRAHSAERKLNGVSSAERWDLGKASARNVCLAPFCVTSASVC